MEKLTNVQMLIGAVLIIAVIITSGLVYIAFSPNPNTITMYTTTSTDNSGLLDYLKPMWEKATGISVDWVAVGTGNAIQAGENGEADVLMVHARTLEDEFVSAGYGMHRVSLMHNDFVLVGPSSDPAGVNGMTNATAVFEKLYQDRNTIQFVTRGDNSGTNVRELELWNSSNVYVNVSDTTWLNNNQWYIDAGSGMSKTLTVASTKQAYTLTDRATFLKVNSTIDLTILAQDPTSSLWANPYGVILVDPAKFPNINIKVDLAKKFVSWLISDAGQAAINAYRINGKQVFFADFQNYKSQMSTSELNYWNQTI